jgi:alcohol dehydrogenase class IV
MFPKFAVLEPKLLLGAPFKVLMSSALDCLVHAIEAVTSKNATSFAKTLGVSAVQKVFEHLPRVKANPKSLEDLEALQIAASEAGLAMLNSSGGPASGISYPLGVHHKVPHGFAGGLLLPLVVAENISNGFDGYAVFLTFKAGTSADFLEGLLKLYSDIQAPKNLAEWNFTSEKDLEFIIERTLAERSVNLELNPIAFSAKSVRKVLTACLP